MQKDIGFIVVNDDVWIFVISVSRVVMRNIAARHRFCEL